MMNSTAVLAHRLITYPAVGCQNVMGSSIHQRAEQGGRGEQQADGRFVGSPTPRNELFFLLTRDTYANTEVKRRRPRRMQSVSEGMVETDRS